MTKQSFLCTACRDGMCDDCRDIAEEFDELLKRRTAALANAQDEIEKLKRKYAELERRANMYEEMSKVGLGDIIGAWMDKEIGQILKVKS